MRCVRGREMGSEDNFRGSFQKLSAEAKLCGKQPRKENCRGSEFAAVRKVRVILSKAIDYPIKINR